MHENLAVVIGAQRQSLPVSLAEKVGIIGHYNAIPFRIGHFRTVLCHSQPALQGDK